MSAEPSPAVPSFESRIHGTLLGGALGDSLGYAVEFDDVAAIRSRYGAAGLTSFQQLDGGSHFSDDTQMTLYTVDGLVEALEWANDGVAADETACLWLAYLRWLGTQGVALPASAPIPQPRWIDRHEVLKHARHPGKACLSGLRTGEMGTLARPVNPDSKGCGTVMRSAPFGLVPHISEAAVYKLSTDGAALTHGHPSARQSAGAFSLLIHKVAAGSKVRTAAEHALDVVGALPDAAPELPQRLRAALELSASGSLLSPEELTARLGEGWVAEEALAVGLYAVLATADAHGDPADHFRSAVAVAVNHSGDSDSTGSIAGNILGAFYGEAGLPSEWLDHLEGQDVIRGMAQRLVAVTLG
ncbi:MULTISPECIES: ADP-ribosylglycohydrolase family protein [Arthrobacter]|uniref:ADP-ribosylglycohydrolase family protein n=1 Tax=Arthrobacter terricola TaxID=2547396 RepID=A0A4R5KLG7_9MICC|nr:MULTISPECIES: ADP-ribosylglycohydrolase family protein [Arthrobacter]MBT8161565.1 ADP-ribosylglycohydrolase family protein [Arthrobacter sp. GN70]TDF95725.1 ADP-ribosylglycohydrolase family protein [Arthrobacter terricola]